MTGATTGIVGIVAKLITLVDSVLSVFVTASWTTAGGACNVQGVNTTITDCGAAIVTYLTQLVYFGLQVGGQMMPALGPI